MLCLRLWATQDVDARRCPRPCAGLTEVEHRLVRVVRREHARQQRDTEEEAEQAETDERRSLAEEAACGGTRHSAAALDLRVADEVRTGKALLSRNGGGPLR